MSGNAKQRRVERHQRELVELGRRAKVDLDARAAELERVRAAHAAELDSMRLRYEHELADVQQRYAAEVESWARASRADSDTIAAARFMLQTETERRQALQAELDEIRRGGLITRREHEAGVEAATAKLRERLRRKSEERLAPKTVVLEQLAADPKPRTTEPTPSSEATP